MLSRKIWLSSALTLVVATAVALPLTAQVGPFAIGAKISTLGPGIEGELHLAGPLALRGNIAFYTYNRTEEIFDSPGQIKAKFSSKSLIADLHPFSGAFRLSAGMIFTTPIVTAHATTSGTITFNNHDYTNTQVTGATLTINGKKTSPYFGLGFDKSVYGKGRIAFGFELGVVSWGRPEIVLVPETTLTGAQRAQLQADIDGEIADKRSDIEDKVPGKAKLFPVIGFALKFKM